MIKKEGNNMESKFLDKERLVFMRKWLEYVPEDWKLEKILKKRASDLSNIELQRLKSVRQEQEMANCITYFCEQIPGVTGTVNMSFEESKKLAAIDDYFDFETIALNKMNEEKLREIHKLIACYDGTNHFQIEQNIALFSNELMRDYCYYMLSRKDAEYTMKKMNEISFGSSHKRTSSSHLITKRKNNAKRYR